MIVAAVVSAICIGLLSYRLELGIWIIPAIVVGLYALNVFYHNPKIWVYTAAASMGAFVTTSGEGVSIIEVLIVALNAGGILVWIIWKLLVTEEYHAVFRGWFDFLYILYIVCSIFTVIPSIYHGGTFFTWAQEWYIVLISLWYMPIRYYLKTEKDWLILLGCMIFSAVWVTVSVVLFYQLLVKSSMYAYQLTGLRHNHAIGIATIAGCATVLVRSKLRFIWQLILAGSIAACFVGVVASFGRTGMLAAVISLVVVLLLSHWKGTLRVLMYMVLSFAAVSAVVTVKFGSVAPIIGKVLSNRVLSSSKGLKDPTVIQRLQEKNKVLELIAKSPEFGHGINVEYAYYDSLLRYSWKHTYVHNGYVGMFFKVGVALGILFYLLIVVHLFRLVYVLFVVRKGEGLVYLRVSCALIVFLFAAHLTETQFFWKQSSYAFALSLALYYYTVDRFGYQNRLQVHG